ncbi:MAG TPA: GNAT family N-acetyltransferase [Actinomycetota bacterium]|jgi:predicted acetyltransferase
MDAVYRGIGKAERERVAALMMLGFGMPQRSEYGRRVEADEFRVLEVDGEVVSLLRRSRLAQFWLGRALPSAQLLQFATPPEHRARGYGAVLLARLMAELHDDGVPTVTLRPSTAAFYRTVGFELAGSWSEYQVRCEHLPRSPAPWRVRRLGLDALGPVFELYERLAPTRHGALVRDGRWWRRFTRDWEGEPATCLVVEDAAGALAGWALVAFEPGPMVPGEEFRNRIDVLDWGCLPGAERGLLAALAGWAPLGGYLQWSGPDPDPVLFALDNEHATMVGRAHWMLRLVDLAAAFAGRPYPAEVAGEVGFTVQDAVCPWNAGGWRLALDGGKAEVTRVAAAPAGWADPRGLAALFTGFADPGLLAAAGLLGGFDTRELDLLRAAFAGPRPWTAEHY